MANIVPGAIWRPIPIDYSRRPKRHKGRGLIGHIAVSSSPDLRGNPNGNCWTFYLPEEGPAIQQIDLDYVSGASVEGDATCATFESQGGLGPIADVHRQKWTPNQVEWAARILLHMHLTEGVPLEVMPNSRLSSRGFGTHRLGIDPYRIPDGEQWSTKYGKACPGDARHEQRHEVVALAQRLKAGQSGSGTTEEDDMACFITDGSGPWWLYDGFRRRYVHPLEPQQLRDLGLAKGGVKKIPPADLARIPIYLPDPVDEKKLAAELATALQPQPDPAGS